jgi:hypothetical protein
MSLRKECGQIQEYTLTLIILLKKKLRIILLNNKKILMGKLLEKLGLKMQEGWKKFQCFWNCIVSKLMFNVESCPNKLCTCKK